MTVWPLGSRQSKYQSFNHCPNGPLKPKSSLNFSWNFPLFRQKKKKLPTLVNPTIHRLNQWSLSRRQRRIRSNHLIGCTTSNKTWQKWVDPLVLGTRLNTSKGRPLTFSERVIFISFLCDLNHPNQVEEKDKQIRWLGPECGNHISEIGFGFFCVFWLAHRAHQTSYLFKLKMGPEQSINATKYWHRPEQSWDSNQRAINLNAFLMTVRKKTTKNIEVLNGIQNGAKSNGIPLRLFIAIEPRAPSLMDVRLLIWSSLSDKNRITAS